MSSGIYIRSQEYCEEMSKRKKGICFNTGKTHFKKGQLSWNKGKKLHYQIWNKGLKLPQFSGINHPNFGKKLSGELRKKYSLSHLGIFSKEKRPNWKGGLSTNKEYLNLKNKKRRHLLGISKRYREEIKGLPKIYHRKRRKYLLKNAGDLTIQTIQQVYEDNIKKFGTLTCYLCLKPIEFSQDSLEHKIPLSRGGTNQKENLAIAHFRCNCKKHTKTLEEYMEVFKK